MLIKQQVAGPFQMNIYIVIDEDSKECILIDPSDDVELLFSFIDENGLNPVAIFNTHAHIDHVCYLSLVKEKYKIPFYLSELEQPLLNSLKQQGEMFGIDTAEPPIIDHFLEEGQTHQVGQHSFQVLHAPGHSPGSMCFLFEKDVIVGDVLFYDSIGRTDLYMGNYDQLINSIKTKLLVLNENLNVYPGHGPQTTIGREKELNPFLQNV
jgi:glyoxylase-like metal-dependent hydrolase (beta-lactamase superfamily II)